ncbi:MAG: amidohydrolase, partial [Bacteroidetes bacterium]|nr:amidohydrolase [Bacteroidota bacterium]
MNIKIQNNIEDSLQAELVEYRRHIHSYPELGFKEFETAKYIKSILNKYNIETKDICETGFVADIGKGGH